MSSQLTVKVAPLRELFSESYRFKLPWFQRAYAWQIQQVGRLLTNLFEGIEAPPENRFYMLGNLMLAGTGLADETALVDGHQRILTVTILFAVLRDLETDPARRAALHSRISRLPEGAADSTNSYHLTPQSSLLEFLDASVQRPGATATELDAYPSSLSETERNILENRDYLRSELSADSVPEETRRNLAQFLEEACHVVIRMADNEENAWEMLRIEEETRLDFHKAASAKASLIGVMEPKDRSDAARVWEYCQRLLGAQDTYSLLSHVRAMKQRKRSSASMEADVCRLFTLDKSGLSFMETIFEPNAQAMSAIRAGAVSTGENRKAIARATEMMAWINPDLWMPAALQWIKSRGEDAPDTVKFFNLLERLVWVQKLAGIDPPRQETRINHLLNAIDTRATPDNMADLKIEQELRKDALVSLRRDNFGRKHIAVNVLRRLSVELNDDPQIFTAGRAPTVEHIFPRSPPANSDWVTVFPNKKQWKNYVNRLGNLTVLTPTENQAAGNHDWSTKKQVLKNSTYALSVGAAKQDIWTTKVIEQRTEDLVKVLFNAWDLST